MFKNQFILLSLIVLLSSCKKDKNLESDNNGKLGPGIYVYGHYNDITTTHLMIWKNAVETDLGPSGERISTGGLLKKGDDVYLVGDVKRQRPFYIKNSVPVYFDKDYSYAETSGIAVKGNDVYISGYCSPTINDPTNPVFWKNQQMTPLTGSRGFGTYGIGLAGDDLYIAGSDGYWKNGAFNAVPTSGGTITCMSTSGSDVYFGGYIPTSGGSRAAYWKNGVLVQLDNGSKFSQLAAIYASGSTVYAVSGRQYWKNGVPTDLDNSEYSEIFSITVDKSDNVYVCGNGTLNTGKPISAYWKNGVSTILPGQKSYAKAIMIIE